MTNANVNQLVISVYFLIIDVFMMSQWAYYTRYQRNRKAAPLQQVVIPQHSTMYNMNSLFVVVVLALGAVVLAQDVDLSLSSPLGKATTVVINNCENSPPDSFVFKLFGTIFAWCSGLLYFSSR